jgi:hypothetical protein
MSVAGGAIILVLETEENLGEMWLVEPTETMRMILSKVSILLTTSKFVRN